MFWKRLERLHRPVDVNRDEDDWKRIQNEKRYLGCRLLAVVYTSVGKEYFLHFSCFT